jgi:hypothetical protein
MSKPPGTLRRIYDGVALFAVLNAVVLSGLVAYLLVTGAIDEAKLQQVVMVLRGVALPTAPTAVVQAAADQPKTVDSGPRESDADVETAYRESERIKTELQQRLALSNSILLKVRTEREAFQKEREAAQQTDEAAAQRQRDEGFKKQVAILESVAPKIAIQHLLSIADPDEAAKVLTAMDTTKAKKVVESAKRGDDLNRMKAILQRVRDVAPMRIAELSENER